MPRAIDMVSFTATQPNTGLAMTAVAGDSGQVRNAAPGTVARIVAAWSKAQAVGFTQIVFPSGNDQTRNIRFRNTANAPVNSLPLGWGQPVQPQETMVLTQAGSNTAGDVELAHLLLEYEDLPGIQGRFIGPDELASQIVRLVTVEDTITPTVASTYSGPRALNAASALLQANTNYAVLGVNVGVVCGAITIRGADIGNLRTGVPGQALANDLGINWFVRLSEWFGRPFIPVFNYANAGNIFTEVVQDENLVAVPFSWMLAELNQ